MGCVGSRLEESEVVSLCRDRVRDLAAAGDYRYVLADAHASYIHLLRTVGGSLHRFFLTLPAHTKENVQSPPRLSSLRVDTNSHSHLKLNSSDDDSDEGDDDNDGEDEAYLNSHNRQKQLDPIENSAASKTETCLNFAKKDVTVSTVTYDAGEGGISSSSYACSPPHSNPPTYDGFIESSLPPPLPPPQSSSWDFLNPFDYYQIRQQAFTFSQSSRDLREEEGIPDLEDEEHEAVMAGSDNVEEFASRTSSFEGNGGDSNSSSKDDMVCEDEGRRSIDRNVFADQELQRKSNGGRQGKVVVGSSSSIPDVMDEINVNFEEASASCEELCRILEVGKLPYHKSQYDVVSSKMRHAMNSNSPSDNGGSIHLDFDEEKGMKYGNLSSTLQKLYVWEKKLYEEVKAIEVMQICHEKKCKLLKQLYDKGTESRKIDSMRDAVMKSSTEIRIAIQVIDSISKKINKLRDEELWPEILELIQGLAKMWQTVTKCHRSQFQAVIESNNLDVVAYASSGRVDDEHMKSTMQLALDLLKWIEIFSFWIDTQKSYVKSLNGWLMKCLPSDREETVDGLIPFSPERLGAPLVFVICNDWFIDMAKISEQEVVEAIDLFTSNVMQVWKKHYEARLDSMNANEGNDRQINALGKEDQQFWKAVDAVNKNQSIIMHLYNDKARTTTKPICLQEALQNIFKALERFSENHARIYEELCARSNEESNSVVIG